MSDEDRGIDRRQTSRTEMLRKEPRFSLNWGALQGEGDIGADLGVYRIMLAAVLLLRDQGCKQIDHSGGFCINLVKTW